MCMRAQPFVLVYTYIYVQLFCRIQNGSRVIYFQTAAEKIKNLIILLNNARVAPGGTFKVFNLRNRPPTCPGRNQKPACKTRRNGYSVNACSKANVCPWHG